MMATESLISDSLSNQLEICIQIQFTGRLDVQAGNGQSWSLYFCMGRLLWICGGGYGLMRWRRLLLKYCHQMQDQNSFLAEVQSSKGQGYDLLSQWVKQQQITGAQAANVIRSTIAEVLFDILQQEKAGQLSYTTNAQDTLDASLTLVHPRQALIQSQQEWAAWSHAGLDNLSPNAAPVLRQLDSSQQPTSLQGYQTLVKVIDGQRTLRDLSLLLNQDLLLLTRILIVYVRKGALEWVQIPDLLPLELDVVPSGEREKSEQLTQSTLLDQIRSPLEKELLQTLGPLACVRLQKILQETDDFLNEIEKLVLDLPASRQKSFRHQLQVLMTRLQTDFSEADQPSPVTPIDPAFIEQCQQQLTYCIGPIASYLIKKLLISEPEISAHQLVNALAAQIENPQQAQEFRDYLRP
jgi:hypothetical protein